MIAPTKMFGETCCLLLKCLVSILRSIGQKKTRCNTFTVHWMSCADTAAQQNAGPTLRAKAMVETGRPKNSPRPPSALWRRLNTFRSPRVRVKTVFSQIPTPDAPNKNRAGRGFGRGLPGVGKSRHFTSSHRGNFMYVPALLPHAAAAQRRPTNNQSNMEPNLPRQRVTGGN